LFSANGSNGGANMNWYHLFPDGTIRAYDSTKSNVSQEPVIGQVSPMIYQDPDLLVTIGSLPAPGSPTFAQTAYTTQQTLGGTGLALTGPISNFQNAYGQNEIWFRSANGSNSGAGQGYYQLLPNGTLHPWNGVVGTDISKEPVVATLGNGGTVSPNSSYWFNPSLLVNALPPAAAPAGPSASIGASSPSGPTVNLSGYANFTGTFGVLVTVNGLPQPSTVSFLANVTDSPLSLTQTSLNGTPTTPPVVPTETVVPTNVTGNAVFAASDPDIPPATPTPSAKVVTATFAVDEMFGLIFNGDYSQSLYGAGVDWLKSTNNSNPNHLNWFHLFPDGTVRAWNGSMSASGISSEAVLATLDASLFSNPDLLATGDAAQAAWDLENKFGGTGIDLTGTGSMLNAYGFGEKWFQSGNGSNAANGGFYQITPDGVVHQWDGGRDIATEPVVGRLNGSYFNNPNLITSLFGAPQPAQPPSGITPTVGGTAANPTVTLSGATSFVGTFGISTTLSDGPSSAAADFLVKTAQPLSLPSPGAQTAHVGASPQLQVTLNASDPDNPQATLTFQAAVFNSMLDAQAFALSGALGLSGPIASRANSLGGSEEWFHSSNGNNAANGGFYLLFPDGNLRQFVGNPNSPPLELGSADSNINPLVATFNNSYWQTPSNLLSPTQAPSRITVGISGNQLTFSGFNASDAGKTYFVGVWVTDGTGMTNTFTTFSLTVQNP
jgi:hypothetical protein